MIRRIPHYVSIACFFLVIGGKSCHWDSPNIPVNLLIIYPDQMRGQAMGFLGLENVKTPHLDKFAAQIILQDFLDYIKKLNEK